MKIDKSYLLKVIQEELEALLDEQRIRGLAPGSRRNRRYARNNPQYFGDYSRVRQFGSDRRGRSRRRLARGADRGQADMDQQFARSNPNARGTMGGTREDPFARSRTIDRGSASQKKAAYDSGLIKPRFDDDDMDPLMGMPNWKARAMVAQQQKDRAERNQRKPEADFTGAADNLSLIHI